MVKDLKTAIGVIASIIGIGIMGAAAASIHDNTISNLNNVIENTSLNSSFSVSYFQNTLDEKNNVNNITTSNNISSSTNNHINESNTSKSQSTNSVANTDITKNNTNSKERKESKKSSNSKSTNININTNSNALKPSSSNKQNNSNTSYSTKKSSSEKNGNTKFNCQYILNTNSKKFHRPTCSSVATMKPSNTKQSNNVRSDIISQGYSPCKRCNP